MYKCISLCIRDDYIKVIKKHILIIYKKGMLFVDCIRELKMYNSFINTANYTTKNHSKQGAELICSV